MFQHRLAENVATWMRKGVRRVARSRRQFDPRLGELEARALLSNITVLNNADGGSGSLRAAISSAAPGDVVSFARSLRGQTILLASPLDIGTSLTIRGFAGGPVVSGNRSTEIFAIAPGNSVVFSTLKMVGGSAARGGAIDNSGALTINSCVFQNNVAVGDAATAGSGGAVFNESGARLTISNSRFSGNNALDNVTSGSTAYGGAIEGAPGSATAIRGTLFSFNQAISAQGSIGRAAGGAIDSNGAVFSISTSRFNGDVATGFTVGEGGAFSNRQGTVTISTSNFSNNKATAVGPGGSGEAGAVSNVGAASAATIMTIRTSSFLRNQAVATPGGDGASTFSCALGGAMGNSGPGVVVNVITSSFAGNQAIAAMPSSATAGNILAGIAVGGAIENDMSAVLTVRSSAITGNRAIGGASGADGSGGAAFGGGIGDYMGTATLNVTNSTVAGNSVTGGGGMFGVGSGGGIAVFQNGRASISGVTFAGNRASGATSADGSPASIGGGGALLVGLAFGSGTPGFIFPDATSVVVSRASITGNRASGGSGFTAGEADGGGIDLSSGSLVVQSTLLAGNSTRGGSGNSGGQSGNGFGGGAFAAGGTSLQFTRSTIVGNLAAGGPIFMGALPGTGIGGGLYTQPAASVTLSATFVTGNSATTSSSQIFGPYQRT